MSEPFVPVPPPEDNAGWDTLPARCVECRSIVDVRHEAGGAWEHEMGYCAEHGLVRTVYGDRDSQRAEKGDNE